MVIATSASVPMASWSVAIAEVRLTSPAGGTTWAELTSSPVAAGLTVPVAVKTTLAPTGTVTDVLMFPFPVATQVPPPVPAQVHVTPVSIAGNVSVTVAPLASLGPSGFVIGDGVGRRQPGDHAVDAVGVRDVEIGHRRSERRIGGRARADRRRRRTRHRRGVGDRIGRRIAGRDREGRRDRAGRGGRAAMPRLHGKAVVQSPPFETNVRPGGVGSVSVTLVASDGPAFVTAIV